MEPEVGRSKAPSKFSNVVLPDPLGPTTARFCPDSSWNEIPLQNHKRIGPRRKLLGYVINDELGHGCAVFRLSVNGGKLQCEAGE